MISWKASLQSVVPLSTTEVEFMTITEATKEALWLQGLVGEFGVKQEPILVFSDNQSAIHLIRNQGFHERTKHIDVWLHFIREVVNSQKVKVVKVHIDDNPADFITKPITSTKFDKCMNLIGVSKLDTS